MHVFSSPLIRSKHTCITAYLPILSYIYAAGVLFGLFTFLIDFHFFFPEFRRPTHAPFSCLNHSKLFPRECKHVYRTSLFFRVTVHSTAKKMKDVSG